MQPLVIGHRGAPAYLPEHSAEGYRLAIRLGADALETDVVMSRDGALVVRHENELSRTTDIAARPEFAHLRTERVVGRRHHVGWFAEDLTLAQLRTLGGPTAAHPIMTLDELLLLVGQESVRARRRIGLHVEIKHPAYFAALGLPMAEPVLAALRDHGLDAPGSRTWVQSFDPAFVRSLRSQTRLPLVQLWDPRMGVPDCAEIAAYADALGPKRTMVRPKGLPPTTLVDRAHAAGMRIFVWTLRRGEGQARKFYDCGVDGVFSDTPDKAVAALGSPEVEAIA